MRTLFFWLAAWMLLMTGCTVQAVVPAVPPAPPGVAVRADVARGYEAYEAALAPHGTWEPDPDHGVHWCPRLQEGESFRPFVTGGRWELSEEPIGAAPAGVPMWVGESSLTWMAWTTRHGYWVQPARRGWCWVPGVEETPGHVVWRWGDGFVGWAPEDPVLVCDDVDYEMLEWFFTLIGTVLEDNLQSHELTGDAREAARHATSSSRRAGRPPRTGPPAKEVTEGRRELQRYAEEHAVTLAQAVRVRGDKKSSSDSSQADSDQPDRKKVQVLLMPAPAYYDVLLGDPGFVARGAMPRVLGHGTPPRLHGSGEHVGAAPAAMHSGSSVHAASTTNTSSVKSSHSKTSRGRSSGGKSTIRSSSSSRSGRGRR